MGDPAGIGPEVVLRALAATRAPRPLTIFGDRCWLEETCRHLRISQQRVFTSNVTVVDCPEAQSTSGRSRRVRRGQRSASAGRIAYACLTHALAAWQRGEIDALVTAPVSKAAIQAAGHWFPGHTEWLARCVAAPQVEMLLIGGGLRVLPVTRHVPLRSVPRMVTAPRLRAAIELCASSLREQFGIERPRIAVAGLNPHAGEFGRVGSEERRILQPAIHACRRRHLRVQGPISPDAVFLDARAGRFDAVLVMYHEQGLIPLKMLARDEGVNVTLGLPFVRTAPDHGTAFDIAPHFCAHPGAMIAAIRLALELSRHTSL